jgi:hypothetical protein
LPQWLELDLKAVSTFNTVEILFDNSGNSYNYEIATSNNRENWVTVTQNTASGSVTNNLGQSITARYIRISINSNSGGNFAQIGEVAVLNVIETALSPITWIGVAASDTSGSTSVIIYPING